jgi:hypothetical protein
MASSETGGVVVKSNWNNAAGAVSSAAMPLVDESGAATATTLTWSANNTWSTPITDQPGNARMMKGYLDTLNTTTTTITVAGLKDADYDVYIYCDGDNRSYTRTAAYTLVPVGGAAVTVTARDAASTNFAGTFTAGANYVTFTIHGTGFTLSATPQTGTNTTLRAPVNGLQIVPR